MVAKFRSKCKASEGTLTQLTDAMEPSELHKLNVNDANDDSASSLPDDTFVDDTDLNDDDDGAVRSVDAEEKCTVADAEEMSGNEYDEAYAEDGESETVFF